MQVPQANAFGRDKNNRPAVGGFKADGTALTAEMLDGTAAGLGILKTSTTLAPAAAPATAYIGSHVASMTTAAAISATPGTAVSSIALENASGSLTAPNTDIIWVAQGSFTLPNTAGNRATPIYPGQTITVALDNPAKLFAMSPTVGQILQFIST